MLNCPEGHPNLPGFEFCGECGAPLEEEPADAEAWYRAKWAIVGAGILAVIVLAGVAVALAVTRAHGPTDSSPPASERAAAIEEWWSGAKDHVEALQDVLDDSQRAVERLDDKGLETACQEMHDLAAVDVRAHLPSPDPDVTSELQAAIEDAHEAAHMCLAAAAGTVNKYGAEFIADVDQAGKHVTAVKDLVATASRRYA